MIVQALAAGELFSSVIHKGVGSGGERIMTTEQPRTDQPRTPDEATEEAARVLARALAEARRIVDSTSASSPATVSEPSQPSPSAAQPQAASSLLAVAERLDAVARDLGAQVERLAGLLERMEHRTGAVAPESAPHTGFAGPPPSREPSFAVGDTLTLVVSGVPGFQGLMDVQRALTGLEGIDTASVRRYQAGEATIEVVLSRPMSAGDIAAGIRDATEHQLVVEEAQPEAMQLHLRCLPSEA